jgi:predicted NAD/FAD-binding protein
MEISSYWMNQLLGIDPAQLLFVSLNPERQIPDGLIFDQTDFDHPVFDQAAIAAQVRIGALQGLRGTRFADAHLGHGFHQDGLASALALARALKVAIAWEKDASRQSDAAQQKIRPPVLLPGLPVCDPMPAQLF